jgi:hypothetical protein
MFEMDMLAFACIMSMFLLLAIVKIILIKNKKKF